MTKGENKKLFEEMLYLEEKIEQYNEEATRIKWFHICQGAYRMLEVMEIADEYANWKECKNLEAYWS